MKKVIITTKSSEETKRFGELIAPFLFPNSLVLLNGVLGAGKTTLAKGIAKGMGVREEVNSPTFNILKIYEGAYLKLYHIDAYRLEDVASENKNIGLEEVIEGDGVTLVEWSDFIKEFLHTDTLNIDISYDSEIRTVEISSTSEKYNELFMFLEDLGCTH
ncbi:MAG TPA: tRNA (adenosine(37)-N6)-threonylcarbamoyltransferase complex ATPase subunit type 1 TsaE [Candidatus Onthovivens sp.]|nr:tRNA (adenosine(37)-N6)-threonylcarbamoyltransferase complex ATPase subunit type 1 TsaE [Candidatus Onthovivens sp.]